MVQSEAEVSVLNRNRGEQRQWMGVVCVQHQVSTRSSKQGEGQEEVGSREWSHLVTDSSETQEARAGNA